MEINKKKKKVDKEYISKRNKILIIRFIDILLECFGKTEDRN